MKLTDLGYVPNCDRRAAGHCRIPTACEIPTGQLEGDGNLPATSHDDHVDLH